MVFFTYKLTRGSGVKRNPTKATKHGLLHLLASRRLRGGEKTNDSKKAWSSSLILVIRLRENQRQRERRSSSHNLVIRMRENQRQQESMVFFTYSCDQGE
jgi:hypothetical protein